MSGATLFARLPSEAQRAAVAVQHLEDVELEEVMKAVRRLQRHPCWAYTTTVDDYLIEIRRFVRMRRRAAECSAIAANKVVSLAAFRKARRAANV